MTVLLELIHIEQQRCHGPVELTNDRGASLLGHLRSLRGNLLGSERLGSERLGTQQRASVHPCRRADLGSIVMLRHKYGLPELNCVSVNTGPRRTTGDATWPRVRAPQTAQIVADLATNLADSSRMTVVLRDEACLNLGSFPGSHLPSLVRPVAFGSGPRGPGRMSRASKPKRTS